MKGEGNQQDYGMRVYDPRVGKFLSVDPMRQSYPELTPYQFASNRPIDAVDIDGAEAGHWDPERQQWMDPSDALRHPLPPGAFLPSNDAAKGGRETAKSGFLLIGVGGLIALDSYTGFTGTRIAAKVYAATQAASIVAHNKAKTPEAIKEQNRQGEEALTETLVGVGVGYTFEALAPQFKNLYNFVKTKAATRGAKAGFESAGAIVARRGGTVGIRVEGFVEWDELKHIAIMSENPLSVATSTDGRLFRAVIQNIEAEYGDNFVNVLSRLTNEARSVGASRIEIKGIEIVNGHFKKLFQKANGGKMLGYDVEYSHSGSYGEVTLSKDLLTNTK